MYTLYYRTSTTRWQPIHSIKERDDQFLIEKAKELKNSIGDFCIVSGTILHGISTFKTMEHQVLWKSPAKHLTGSYKVIIKNGKKRLISYNPEQLFLKYSR